MRKRITNITIEGYKSIRAGSVAIKDVTVLVGANGAGKSNFIAVLDLLGRIVDERLGLEVGLRGGASSLLQVGEEGAEQILIRVDAGTDSPDFTNSYEAVLVPAANDELIFASESTYFRDTKKYPEPFEDHLGNGHRESRLGKATGIGAHVREMLRGCRVYHFQDTSIDAPVKKLGYAADNETLT
jgi:predicted ATPase